MQIGPYISWVLSNRILELDINYQTIYFEVLRNCPQFFFTLILWETLICYFTKVINKREKKRGKHEYQERQFQRQEKFIALKDPMSDAEMDDDSVEEVSA